MEKPTKVDKSNGSGSEIERRQDVLYSQVPALQDTIPPLITLLQVYKESRIAGINYLAGKRRADSAYGLSTDSSSLNKLCRSEEGRGRICSLIGDELFKENQKKRK